MAKINSTQEYGYKAKATSDMSMFKPDVNKGYNANGWDGYTSDIRKDYSIYDSSQKFNKFNKFYRFGYTHLPSAFASGREVVFFVKPDLYIANKHINKNSGPDVLQPDLAGNVFFRELLSKWPLVARELQWRADANRYPFSLLLSNTLASNVDMPSLSANTIATATNNFGTNYEYRGSSEASDDNYDFSLEFRDDRYLDTYMYFRAYEEYERLKSQGYIRLYKNKNDGGQFSSMYSSYMENRVLHDMLGIYKFILREDMETILYYSYFTGVMWKSLPRDGFSSADFNDGLKFAIDAKAAFVEDMAPWILSDFQFLSLQYAGGEDGVKTNFEYVPTVDVFSDHNTNMRPAKLPLIYHSQSNGKDTYKLTWFRKKSEDDDDDGPGVNIRGGSGNGSGGTYQDPNNLNEATIKRLEEVAARIAALEEAAKKAETTSGISSATIKRLEEAASKVAKNAYQDPNKLNQETLKKLEDIAASINKNGATDKAVSDLNNIKI